MGFKSGDKMSVNDTICEIQCVVCRQWFNSPSQFEDAETFFSSDLIGNLHQCEHCGKMTPCIKENIRFIVKKENGRLVYSLGKNKLVNIDNIRI